MTVKTRGIVLGQIPMRDQDKKLIILTQDMGLIEAIARKVNGARSSLSAAAEVLAYSDFCLYAGKSGYIVNTADLLENFYPLYPPGPGQRRGLLKAAAQQLVAFGARKTLSGPHQSRL